MKSLTLFFCLLILTSNACDSAPELSSNQVAINPSMESGSSKKLINHLLSFLTNDHKAREEALYYLRKKWNEGYVTMILDVIYLSRNNSAAQQLYPLLNEKTNQHFDQDIHQWHQWIWNQETHVLPAQADFMAELYQHIDPKFKHYFAGREEQSRIRLDEVRWGGVPQDGIPPLRQPKMISASKATYLEDQNIVFGIEVNGDARAYPKRILAWHEMFVDEVGGIPLAGVYCTLCGTVILYETTHDGVEHGLGTSGFLYRSNKLMYDKATQSLWSTINGQPVIGPLVDQGIELKSRSVVTTTWGEWRRRHSDTKVLSLETGHRRDYGEGVAYHNYFATDDLMFKVPKLDQRLKNKAEVLIVRAEGYQTNPLAISADFLKKERIYHDQINQTPFVVLTDKSGGNRVYQTGTVRFKKLKRRKTVIDENDGVWQIKEDQLTGPDGQVLKRLPYHRIFWFAWFNNYQNTRLVK